MGLVIIFCRGNSMCRASFRGVRRYERMVGFLCREPPLEQADDSADVAGKQTLFGLASWYIIPRLFIVRV